MKRVIENAMWFALMSRLVLMDLLADLVLPLSLLILFICICLVYRFYEYGPVWARALFALYVFQNIGKAISECKHPDRVQMKLFHDNWRRTL